MTRKKEVQFNVRDQAEAFVTQHEYWRDLDYTGDEKAEVIMQMRRHDVFEWMADFKVAETEVKAKQLAVTQQALKNLYNAVLKSRSVNDPLGMASAMEEAGKWF